jgi:hypothetical protein
MNRLEIRVERLERDGGGLDKFYLIWCRPHEDEDEILRQHAMKGGALDQQVNCYHWKGTGPMPEPRWTSLEDMTDNELNYSLASVKAACIRNGWATAVELNELEREIRDSPAGSWDSSKSRVIAQHSTKAIVLPSSQQL